MIGSGLVANLLMKSEKTIRVFFLLLKFRWMEGMMGQLVGGEERSSSLRHSLILSGQGSNSSIVLILCGTE